MTVLLLDTHAYLWAVAAPAELSDSARSAIADPANTLWVSAASAWEMAIKFRSGKLPEAETLLHQHDSFCARLGAEQRPITASEAIRAGGLAWPHRDPFDRLLAAQALLGQATLVSRDDAFAELTGLMVLW